MNILIYTSFNARSRDTESVMEAFVKQGNDVFLLTQTEKGPYHAACEQLGVKCFHHFVTKNNFLSYYLKHILFLTKFCRKNKIAVIYSHLENASLCAVIAQYFIKSKVVACRHIVNEAYLLKSKKFIIQNRITYLLAKYIIVVSNRSKQFMVDNEKIKERKITKINLAYNFNLFNQPNKETVTSIKQSSTNTFILVTACRLLAAKRPKLSIDIVAKLIESGFDCKLFLLGDGPQREELEKYINDKGLKDKITITGYVNNVLDYISASNIVIIPSLMDSSSVILKETGLMQKTAIICKGIGDADEYLSNEEVFLADADNFVKESVDFILNSSNEKIRDMGFRLKERIHEVFSIENIIKEYAKFNL